MKTNEELQKDVQNAIKWEPLLHAAEIGVSVKDGVVTLTGNVDSYAKKSEAENATKNIVGVKVVVENVEVKFNSSYSKKDDNDIASEILNAYKWNMEVPNDKIKIKVENGFITLEGDVSWNFQKNAARDAVSKLAGVTGVLNNILIKPETQDAVEKADIENALERNWSLREDEVNVKVSNHKVTLTGTVGSWYQKDEAARIAWSAPGVWEVVNELEIEYEYELMD
ncbi:MAG: BON domain-containing protein [Bacteroidota bacterium]